MKKVLLFFLICGFTLSVRSQSLTPFVVSSSGAFFANSAGMLSSTIGELAAVTTLTTGSNILTQGFQQAWDFGVSIPEVHENGLVFGVYPNPGSGLFTVALSTEADSKFTFKVYDVLGKTVYLENRYHIGGVVSYEINLKGMAEGMYLLDVSKVEIASGKISKMVQKINLAY
jgi:hypothetical protein